MHTQFANDSRQADAAVIALDELRRGLTEQAAALGREVDRLASAIDGLLPADHPASA